MSTTIRYADSRRPSTHDTRDEAVAALRAQYPGLVVGDHDGTREFVWRDTASAENDDGARAVAEIIAEDCPYTVRILSHDADEGIAVVSVLYAPDLDSDSAPTWESADDARVAAHLAAELGGTWTLRGEWAAGDHPTRLEAVSTWARAEAAQ